MVYYTNPAHIRKIPSFSLGREERSLKKTGVKIAAQNRKAFHDYFVEEKYEAGIELAGTEVKSIRA